MLTVFTPTYDRATRLAALADALRAQTSRAFEWLVVDDGSSDGTAGVLDALLADDRLAVRVLRQSNSGKHAAWNRAVEAARGRAFVCLDSDDLPADDASLDRMWADHERLSAREGRPASVVYLAADQATGERIGDPFPPGTGDGGAATTYRALFYDLGLDGDRHSIDPVAALRAVPFPEPSLAELGDCSNYFPESLVWFALPGPVVPVDRVELRKEYLAGGITRSRWTAEQVPGVAAFNAWQLDHAGRPRVRRPVPFLRAALQLGRFRAAHGAAVARPPWEVRSAVGRAYLLAARLVLPLVGRRAARATHTAAGGTG